MLVGKLYKVETDTLNVTVFRKYVNRKGGETWKADAYAATLENALRYIVDRDVKETGLTDLKTVIAKQQELYDLIKQTVGKPIPVPTALAEQPGE